MSDLICSDKWIRVVELRRVRCKLGRGQGRGRREGRGRRKGREGKGDCHSIVVMKKHGSEIQKKYLKQF